MFTANKALHCLSVANFMRTWAPAVGVDSDFAWLVGYLHDIGYIKQAVDHSGIGHVMLSKYSLDLARYVLVHDRADPIQDSIEFLLKLGDLSIDEKGNFVGMTARFKSLNMRYGNMSLKPKLALMKDQLKVYAEENNFTELFYLCI